MKLKVTVNGNSYEVEVEVIENDIPTSGYSAPNPAQPKTNRIVRKNGDNNVYSPLVGTVIQVMVEPGDSVAEGQLLLLLEAMKMESEIVAPKAGSIQQVLVTAGDTVQQGSVLIEIA